MYVSDLIFHSICFIIFIVCRLLLYEIKILEDFMKITDDALLICAKDSTQDVKKVIENLKICNRNELV